MNANELADEVDCFCEYVEKNIQMNDLAKEASTMLRKLQAENEELKSRELTDDEIWSLAYMLLENGDVISFARAILRKASEK